MNVDLFMQYKTKSRIAASFMTYFLNLKVYLVKFKSITPYYLVKPLKNVSCLNNNCSKVLGTVKK